ncbi:hypothetical protein MT356_08885 [Rathayibacter festucae]|uniref:hypothetical protein n=1 Tax=Rathayibacter festucae TaxID=110937 RepID=UPI001FB55AD1|nr:hypothetical protein [Rathayibacter festucae]MCJ1699837.1 hypothetical protein [Rathayibacter festucae]
MRTTDGYREDLHKSSMSIRSVPLWRELAEELAEYLVEHQHAAEPTASLWPGRNYGGYGDFHGGLD